MLLIAPDYSIVVLPERSRSMLPACSRQGRHAYSRQGLHARLRGLQDDADGRRVVEQRKQAPAPSKPAARKRHFKTPGMGKDTDVD